MAHVLGVIGGSGLYAMEDLTDVEEIEVDTPWGAPSDALIRGRLDGREIVFLPRHGRGHVLLPTEVPYRANLWAMRKLGVRWVLSISAVGSLREAVEPGHLVVVDQFVDRTRGRPSTFFGGGCVAHVQLGDPICGTLRGMLLEAARGAVDTTIHDGGTYVCMEGPQFSTRAESELYRGWGADVIGMTNVPECKLAREAEISYATLALSTDYDCWHTGHDEVSVEAVVATVKANVAAAQRVIRALLPQVAAYGGPVPKAQQALAGAIMTAPDRISAEARARLGLLIDPHVG
ncbi:MAG: S-methyl-5'-thioadenosine phosphorylase [Alphaproteobacteria bacterium]|nr:S-methyl-5'-thioadenosine phosphorylase [Alphaproteobacteria bacterium]